VLLSLSTAELAALLLSVQTFFLTYYAWIYRNISQLHVQVI